METSALKYSRSELEKMGIKTTTSIEFLQMDPCFYHTAIIPYHNFVIVGIWHGDRDVFSSALYSLNGKPLAIDTEITLTVLDYRSFDDMGEAIKSAISKADELMKGRC